MQTEQVGEGEGPSMKEGPRGQRWAGDKGGRQGKKAVKKEGQPGG